MANTTNRFKKIYTEGGREGTEIWVDRVTGVNYVFHYRGYVEGFTPLLDAEGKPVITPCPEDPQYQGDKKVS